MPERGKSRVVSRRRVYALFRKAKKILYPQEEVDFYLTHYYDDPSEAALHFGRSCGEAGWEDGRYYIHLDVGRLATERDILRSLAHEFAHIRTGLEATHDDPRFRKEERMCLRMLKRAGLL